MRDVIALQVRPSEEESHPNETKEGHPLLIWDEDEQAADNYKALGDRLAKSNNLFRRPGYASGLLLLLDDGKHAVIPRGRNLPR